MEPKVKQQITALLLDTCKFMDGLHTAGQPTPTSASLRDNLEKAAHVVSQLPDPVDDTAKEDKPTPKKRTRKSK